jgi:hypothetical protein
LLGRTLYLAVISRRDRLIDSVEGSRVELDSKDLAWSLI